MGRWFLGVVLVGIVTVAPKVGLSREIELLSGKKIQGEIVKETQDFIVLKSVEGKSFKIKREKVREIREGDGREEGEEKQSGGPAARRKGIAASRKANRAGNAKNYISFLAPVTGAALFALTGGVGSQFMYLRREESSRKWWALVGLAGGWFDFEGVRGGVGGARLGGRCYYKSRKVKPPEGWFTDFAFDLGWAAAREKSSGDSASGLLWAVDIGGLYSWVWKSGFSFQLNPTISFGTVRGLYPTPPSIAIGGLVDLGWVW